MINHSNLDVAALPSVALKDRRSLPETPCIYFAIDGQGRIKYVGKSVNPRQRWLQHHRLSDLTPLNGVRIAYLSTDADLLDSVEAALIESLDPPLNGLMPKGYRRGPAPLATEKKKISAYLDEDLKRAAEALAKLRQMSLSTLVANMLSKEVRSAREDGELDES